MRKVTVFCIFILYLPNSLVALVIIFQWLLLHRELLITTKDTFVSIFPMFIPLNSVSGRCHLGISMVTNNGKPDKWRFKQSGLSFLQLTKSREKRAVALHVLREGVEQAFASPSVLWLLSSWLQNGPCASNHHICASGRKKDKGIQAKRRNDVPASPA